MKSPTFLSHLWITFLLLLLLAPIQLFALDSDGVALLSFKYSVFKDPLSVLQNWNYWDQTPCSWTGVTCSPAGLLDNNGRVTGLALPNSQLTGTLFSDFSKVPFLRNLDLSNNSFNGSLPLSLFNVSELRFLDLSNNLISGELPESVGELKNLQFLNVSENALAGKVPYNLTVMQNLSVVSLSNNYFTGLLPGGFNYVRLLDLSSNLINGSLPLDFGGNSLSYFNISYNKLSGEISPEFASSIPVNATVDFSFNNFTGELPENTLFSNQDSKSFSGNQDLCGKLLNNPCPIPSSLSDPPPNSTSPSNSPPAIAAIPKPTLNSSNSQHAGKLHPITIVAIVVGDLIGIILFVVVFIYVCQIRKTKNNVKTKKTATIEASVAKDDWSTSSSSETKGITAWSCLRKKTNNADDEESSDTTDSDGEREQTEKTSQRDRRSGESQLNKGGSLVTVDGGDKELELETLLKASAYILGATGSSIMYKAVLEDGTVLAVRRIGESGLDRFRDFENQVRVIAKLVHPNLVRIRGFYWGVDEKLVIYDFVPNGSLANARYRKAGSSPCHLPWESRLKIAKGVAKGLAYLHDKKHVHGNLKPSNILLDQDMEPKIGDFGLERLVHNAESSYATGGSSRNFGSKRSTASRESFQDLPTGPSPNPSPSPSSLSCASYYHAPESLRSIKAHPKWDVYAFGVLLLELLTGKVVDMDELTYGPGFGPGFGPGSGPGSGLVVEDKNRAVKMADVAIRGDVEGKEDALLACFKLAISCVSLVPQKRPAMKEVLHVLEKLPSCPSPLQIYGN